MEEKLTEEQLRVALEAVFGDSDRTTEDILAEAGISKETYASWLRDRSYLGYTVSLSALAAEAEGARIIKRLTEEARGGDPKAVKAYIDMLKSTLDRDGGDAAAAERDCELDAAMREVWGDGAL